SSSRMQTNEETLRNDLLSALANWRASIYRIGQILNQMKDEGIPASAYISLLRSHGMPECTARVAMRWAAGEFGGDEVAGMLVSKVPHSVLAPMSKEAIENITTRKHRVYNPHE